MNANPEQLIEQLSQSPTADVLGVVGPSEMAGIRSRSGLWTLLFTLTAWKYPGHAVQHRELTIRKEVPQSEIDAAQRFLKPCEVVRIRTRVVEESVFGNPQGLLVEIVGTESSDEELNECARKLQEPVTFEDRDFGLFTLNRGVNWYETETTWGATPIRLNLSLEDSKDTDPLLEVARSLWDSQETWTERVTDYAVAELLDVKNDTWLDEDEEALSAEQFKSRMTVESITVYADGKFGFWFEDGDLFGGHSILVSGDLANGPTEAGFHG